MEATATRDTSCSCKMGGAATTTTTMPESSILDRRWGRGGSYGSTAPLMPKGSLAAFCKARSFVMFKLSLYSLPPCLFSQPARRFLGQAQISISLPEAIFTPAPVLRHGAPVNKIRNQQRPSQETFEIFFMSPHWVHTFLAEKEQLVDFPPMRIMMR